MLTGTGNTLKSLDNHAFRYENLKIVRHKSKTKMYHLYNLTEDPFEKKDLRKKYPTEVKLLQERMEETLKDKTPWPRFPNLAKYRHVHLQMTTVRGVKVLTLAKNWCKSQ